MRLVSLAVLASASAFVVGPALAQSPLVEKNVSMGMALAIIQGTIEQCTKDGYKVSVTIVERPATSQLLSAATAPIPTPWSLAG